MAADDAALAAVLRAQGRTHADGFLPARPARGPLPRRALLGAFIDGLDVGLWLAADTDDEADPDRLLADAALVLPAAPPRALPASTLHTLVDGHGRAHVDRLTLACCYYFKVAPEDGPCGTCPRVPVTERRRRFTELPDER